MHAADHVPRGAVDLNDLGSLLNRRGPFATAYVATDPAVDNAEQRSLQRWRGVREQLASAGAPDSALDRIEDLVATAHLEGAGLAVVADADEVLLVDHLDESLDSDRGSWGPIPDLVPLLRARQERVPYVVVLADHGGADVIAERPEAGRSERSVGDGEPRRKVAPGGWSQRRYQQRADEDWAATAREVAAEVARVARNVDARVVVVGGDVRSTHLILDALPGEVASIARIIDHGRAADGSEDQRRRAVRKIVATTVAEDSVDVLQRFKEEHGQHDRAAAGAAEVIDACNRSAVDVLLVADGLDGEAWVLPDAPVPIGLDAATVRVGTEDEPVAVPLAHALVRAAAGTGAHIRIVPKAGPVPGGVGALLRWSAQA